VRVGIACSLAPADGGVEGPDDRFEEFDRPETVEAIASVLRADGYDVVLLGDGRSFLTRVLDDAPDFVFNFAEGEGVGRNREARVPAVLEMLGIPHSGSDPLTLAATLDKSIAKQLVRDVVAVPQSVLVPLRQGDADALRRRLVGAFGCPLRGPVILKPNLEGSSKGIRGLCVSEDADEVVARVGELASDYQQPILIEEFVEGHEVTVGLVGHAPDFAFLGSMRVLPKSAGGRFVYSLEVKRDWRRRVEYESPARLDESALGRLREAAAASFAALGCRDVARIDFRVTPDGAPYFIEANPLPGLSPTTSDLVLLARGYGMEYEDLIRMIFRAALERCGLAGPEAGPS
jgi:D-alanine-D-alanine ligase